MSQKNRDRARAFDLAQFYGWNARKPGTPTGNDPRTGMPWVRFDPLATALHRAECIAKARTAYRFARAYGPVPLP